MAPVMRTDAKASDKASISLLRPAAEPRLRLQRSTDFRQSLEIQFP
jgi:hypothetical protein